MGSYNMFQDLPSIDLEYDPFHPNREYQHHLSQWHPAGSYVAKSLPSVGVVASLPPLIPHRKADIPYSPYGDYCDNHFHGPVSWEPIYPIKELPYNSVGNRSDCEGTAPWASTSTNPGLVSPATSREDDRQSSERDCSPGGSTWSPELSECRLGSGAANASSPRSYDTIYTSNSDGQDYERPREAHNDMERFSGGLFQGRLHPHPGIKLEDVQQYPDAYQEEQLSKANDKDGEMQYYPTEHVSPPTIQTNEGCKEQYAEDTILLNTSATDGQNECVTTGEEPVSDADYESSCSDYSPRGQRVSNAARLFRGGKALKPNRKRSFKTQDKEKQRQRVRKAATRFPKVTSTDKRLLTAVANNVSAACPHCPHASQTKSALSKHISTIHTRPFTCTFRLYGCSATFGSKNEWKRHVSSQHLRLGIWRCDLGSCVPKQPVSKNPHRLIGDQSDEDLVFNDFNRKDLFTQHLRRMHGPQAPCPHAQKEAFNASLEPASRRCLIDIRKPPLYSICGYCNVDEHGSNVVFEGPGSWETRMEHVGRHLESEHGHTLQWNEDLRLREWMAAECLIELVDEGKWRLVNLPAEDGKVKRARK